MPSKNLYAKYILNCNASRDRDKNWSVSSAIAAGHLAEETDAVIPKRKDLRRKWWSIENQGKTGSCVGWAVGDTIRWHLVQSNWIAKEERLSARYLWMAAKETDEFTDRPSTFIEKHGTSIKAALGVAYKYGVVLESDVPFSSLKLYDGDDAAFYAKAAVNRITSYFDLGSDLSIWRSWIASQGPVVVRLNVDTTWMDLAIRTDKEKGRLDNYDDNKTFGGHACLLVGYTNHQFIVRNSWGTGWGHSGYAYASDEYARDAFTESYGIVF